MTGLRRPCAVDRTLKSNYWVVCVRNVRLLPLLLALFSAFPPPPLTSPKRKQQYYQPRQQTIRTINIGVHMYCTLHVLPLQAVRSSAHFHKWHWYWYQNIVFIRFPFPPTDQWCICVTQTHAADRPFFNTHITESLHGICSVCVCVCVRACVRACVHISCKSSGKKIAITELYHFMDNDTCMADYLMLIYWLYAIVWLVIVICWLYVMHIQCGEINPQCV